MSSDVHLSHAVSRNPANGEEIGQFPFLEEQQLERCLQDAVVGFRNLAELSAPERASIVERMATTLRENVTALATEAVREMGKPIAQARGEVLKCASLCDWYAKHGPAMVADEPTEIGPNAYVSYLPVGLVLGVMPWNFPFWQAMRNAVGILIGGNGYLFKPAPNVMGCAFLLERLWQAAGLPGGAFTVLNITPALVSKVIADRRVAAVAVTGSVRAGASIAAQAGAAIKKSVLELGGADAFIVLRDADLERAVEAAVAARFQNTGQVCIAAKRLILDEPIATEFTERFIAAVAKMPMGDPMSDATYLGPMARFDLRDELHNQVERTVSEGAQRLLGGRKAPQAGNYYQPTVLAGVAPGMTAFEQEVFGPVASLIEVADVTEAVRIANQSDFGLSAAVWSGDLALAKQVARQLETGGVFINGYAASDPRVPIGGIKRSGYGRELSHFGVREFLNAQVVWVDRR